MGITSLKQALSGFDETVEKIDESKVSAAIRKTLPKDSADSPSTESLAEAMAFDFHEDYRDQGTGWGTYYGPMIVWSNNDGTSNEYPSIKKINDDILAYWASRATEAKHSVLKARYAGLVWEMSKPSTGRDAGANMAQIAIDSILDIARHDRHEHEVYTVTKLRRALSLALSLNDPDRLNAVRDAMIAYEDKIAVDDKLGLWGFCYDELVHNKKIALSGAQEAKLINDLEGRLGRVSEPEDSSKFDPWAAEAAATRLASYYRRHKSQGDVRRVLMKYVNAFEQAGNADAPLRASAWLQGVHSVLLQYGLRQEANQIAVKLRDLGPKVSAEMKPISHSIDISKEKMERYVEAIIRGDLDSALARIALQYIPRRKEVEDQLRDLAKKAPISFLIPRKILDEMGRPVATVGSLEDDLTGHVVTQVSQNMTISSIFLREVMRSLIARFGLSAEMLVDYLYLSPVFGEKKREIIKSGLHTYLDENHLVAAHLLIPQVEDAIRNLVENTGGSVLRQGRDGGLRLKLLDELLRGGEAVKFLSEDVTLYLRILFTDQRGWNLRNGISHGVMSYDAFGAAITDRIVHALLCLALVREQ
jgi:hypothetical protein